jgi:hypothetical protein
MLLSAPSRLRTLDRLGQRSRRNLPYRTASDLSGHVMNWSPNWLAISVAVFVLILLAIGFVMS